MNLVQRVKQNGGLSQATQAYLQSSMGPKDQMGQINTSEPLPTQIGQGLAAPIDPMSDALNMISKGINITPDILHALPLVSGLSGGTNEDLINAATKQFTQHYAAATGDITKEFSPEQVNSAIDQMTGQSLTGDFYKDNAIRLANHIQDLKSGAVMNALPLSGVLGL